ncbi:hypothetical protein CC86DRAFT_153528 [Ophiobolus disseminans]|uniref:Uncharacterized protein n=1 Tax=Ophiobolus disseminans TaxID=1469910 RepID=A0A6A6ZCA7_9PLEO|nr:hypothetical protein CC86DRAFT_153528 [Ophiobolus disseminans]
MEGDIQQSVTKRPRKTLRPLRERASLFGWWWELAAVVVSLVSMSLILTILCYMNNRLLSDWKLPIQLNSLIAIFSTFARSALLVALAGGLSQLKWNHFEKQHSTLDRLQIHDEASRGPWGSVMYLFRMRKDMRAIAALGAVLTILALAFEPFTQQIIEFSPRQTLSSNATAYVLSAERFELKPMEGSHNKDTPALALLQNIIELLYNPSTKYTSHFVCPAADCFMPSHYSLGTCASCDELVTLNSSQMGCAYTYVRNGGDLLSPNDTRLNISKLDVDGFKLIAQRAGAARYLGPSDHYFANCSNMSSISKKIKTVRPKDGFYTKNQTEIYWPEDTMIFDKDSASKKTSPDSVDIVVVNIRALSSMFPKYENLYKWNGLETKLSRCRIKMCAIKTENATIQNGELKAVERRIPLILLEDEERKNNYTNVYSNNDTTSGSSEKIVLRLRLKRRNFGSAVALVMDRLATMEVTTDLLAEMRPDELVDMLSTALNAFMRSSQNVQRSKIPGVAYTTKTYVKVRWEWATLPGIIVLSAVVFLVLTILESDHSKQLFKTSVLTGYFYNIEGSSRENESSDMLQGFGRSGKHNYHSLLERSKGIKVRLTKCEDGRLVFEDESAQNGPED